MRYTKNKISQIFLLYKSNNRETIKTAHILGRKRRSTSTESEFSGVNIKKILAMMYVLPCDRVHFAWCNYAFDGFLAS